VIITILNTKIRVQKTGKTLWRYALDVQRNESPSFSSRHVIYLFSNHQKREIAAGAGNMEGKRGDQKSFCRRMHRGLVSLRTTHRDGGNHP